MRRRTFLAVAGAAVATPLTSRAQQRPPVVGFLHSTSPYPEQAAAFSRGLAEAGFVDGQNVIIEYRWAEGHVDRVAGLASEFARRPVSIIAALGGDVTALAAKAATSTIPIVFMNGSDPVKSGLVASINRPAGNVTGVSMFAGTIDAKRLELLKQLVPGALTVAVFNNALVAETEVRSKSLTDAADTLGLRLIFYNVSDEGDFVPAFRAITQQKVGTAFVSGSPFFISRRVQLVRSAAAYRIPTVYAWREFAKAGGLLSYGADVLESARQGGIYVGRVLKGERPGELPVLQPTKFDLVINLTTAKTLGLTVPPSLLALADEVIE